MGLVLVNYNSPGFKTKLVAVYTKHVFAFFLNNDYQYKNELDERLIIALVSFTF